MALKGTLKDFGIADIFQLIGQQQKTGVLHLLDREQEVHVSFKDGNVCRAESATRKKKELLGDMLVRAGLITERQLSDSLEEQKRTLKRLGDILVSAGHIEREALKQMAHLQTTETLYRLFFWKSGTYEFESAEIDFDPESMSSVRSESVLMEGFRRVDEWPLIRKKVTNTSMTFKRLKDLPEKVAKPAKTEDVDAAFDDAFGEGGDDAGDDDDDEISNNERLVFKLADPGKTVQFIIDRSRLGDFETCRALLNLVNGGYLQGIAAAGAAEGTRLAPDRSRWGEWVLQAAGGLASVVALAGVLAVLAARASPAPGPGGVDLAARRLLGRAQLSRLDAALAAETLRKGESPDSLNELVEAGILSHADLRFPWEAQYHYRKTGPAAYVLLPPVP